MKRLAIVILVVTGCFASRKSVDYECTKQADCAADRVCREGYCILGDNPIDGNSHSNPVCPAACSSCDPTAMTCSITCSNPSDCGPTVTCPAGYACDIHCIKGNSCRGIDCTSARSCAIVCDMANACTTAITCGPGECDVHCNATNACPIISCSSSCGCDVACNQSDPDCGQMSCPTRGGNACTTDGNVGTPCSSTAKPSCNSCP